MLLKLTQQEEEQQWRQSEGCGEAGPAKHLKLSYTCGEAASEKNILYNLDHHQYNHDHRHHH